MIRLLTFSAFLVFGVGVSAIQAHAQSCCVEPTREVSAVYGIGVATSEEEFLAAFSATLSNSEGTTFSGNWVDETTREPGVNSCWYNGSALPKNPVLLSQFSLVTGRPGVWEIAGGQVAGEKNVYGFDYIGNSVDTVNDIREVFDPSGEPTSWSCSITLYQDMNYSCNGGLAGTFDYYWDNILNITLMEHSEQVSRAVAAVTIKH